MHNSKFLSILSTFIHFFSVYLKIIGEEGEKVNQRQLGKPNQLGNIEMEQDAVPNYTSQDVIKWFEEMELTQYMDLFANDKTVVERFLTLNYNDVKEIGVTSNGHINKIVEKIETLNVELRR